jgi:beta-galactosidase
VLSHDLEPNRAYAEVSKTAHELKQIGPELADMKISNQVAILYSLDSQNAMNFMPIKEGSERGWRPGQPSDTYMAAVAQLHDSLYRENVGSDFVFANSQASELAKYKLLIVPVLYVADDALLQRLSAYVHNGGHVLMTYKSGFTNENSAVRWERAPGPLREAAGFTYQEFSNLEKPLALKGDPFHVGAAADEVNTWAEFLQLTTAKPLAYYDHPFFGKWPAITLNNYGRGTLTYEGTLLSDGLQDAVVLDELKRDGLTGKDQELPPTLRVKHGMSHDGHPLHYFLNYSSEPVTLTYAYGAGKDLLTGQALRAGQQEKIGPWDVVIAEEASCAK